MSDKIKTIINKSISFAKSNKKAVFAASAAALILAIIAILLAIFLPGGDDSESNRWGEGITNDIAEFPAEAESMAFAPDGSFAAAYYSNVTGEQISEYISLLSSECGISFSGDSYPRSAIYGDKIIAIHYNVTEMRFSVTVTEKTKD